MAGIRYTIGYNLNPNMAIQSKKNKKTLAEAIIETEESGTALKFPQNFKRHMFSILSQREIYLGGGALVAAVAALVAAFPSIKRYWKISTM